MTEGQVRNAWNEASLDNRVFFIAATMDLLAPAEREERWLALRESTLQWAAGRRMGPADAEAIYPRIRARIERLMEKR